MFINEWLFLISLICSHFLMYFIASSPSLCFFVVCYPNHFIFLTNLSNSQIPFYPKSRSRMKIVKNAIWKPEFPRRGLFLISDWLSLPMIKKRTINKVWLINETFWQHCYTGNGVFWSISGISPWKVILRIAAPALASCFQLSLFHLDGSIKRLRDWFCHYL